MKTLRSFALWWGGGLVLLGLVLAPSFRPAWFAAPPYDSPAAMWFIRSLLTVLPLAAAWAMFRTHPGSRREKILAALLVLVAAGYCEHVRHQFVDRGHYFGGIDDNTAFQRGLQNSVVRLDPGVIPHSYRFLSHNLVAWFEWLGGSFDLARSVYRLLFDTLLFAATFRYARLFLGPVAAAGVIPLVMLIFPVASMFYAGQFVDPASYLSFIAALYFFAKGPEAGLLPTFVLGVLAKESVLALTVCRGFYGRDRVRAALAAAGYFAAGFAVVVGVRLLVHHGEFGYRKISGTGLDQVIFNLSLLHEWPLQYFYTLGILVPGAWLGWRLMEVPIRRTFAVLTAALIVSSLFFSWLSEARNLLPAVIALAIVNLKYVEHRFLRAAGAPAPEPAPAAPSPAPVSAPRPLRRRLLVPALATGLALLAFLGRWLDRPQAIDAGRIRGEGPVSLHASNVMVPDVALPTSVWRAYHATPLFGRVVVDGVPAADRVCVPLRGRALHVHLAWQFADGSPGRELTTSVASLEWQIVTIPAAGRALSVLHIETDLAGPGDDLRIAQPYLADGLHNPTARVAGRLCTWLFALGWIAALATVAGATFAARWPGLSAGLRPLASLFAVALAGYLMFWAYFAHSACGDLLAVALAVGVLGWWWRHADDAIALWREASWWRVWLALLGLGLVYFGFFNVWSAAAEWSWQTAHRYDPGLPGDNRIPQVYAERLVTGVTLRDPHSGWLSSDRPPLQSGWILLLGPVLRADAGVFDALAQAMGGWFQLLWFPALAAFLSLLRVPARRALALAALVGLGGFTVLHSLFVWPKLAAAAFVLGAWVFLGGRREIAADRRHSVLGGLGFALGFLSHGGVAFSLLALGPLWLWSRRAAHWRSLALVGLVAAVTCAPWWAYQRFYEPPGTRLVKWHLAGQVEPDARGTWQTLRASYAAKSWGELWQTRLINARYVFTDGHWSHLLDFSAEGRNARRVADFFHLFRNLGWWNLGLLALPLAWWRLRRGPADAAPVADALLSALLWVGATLALWIALMFLPLSTVIHQGSFVPPLLLLGLAAWSLHSLHPRALAAVAALALACFFATYAFTPPPGFHGGFVWFAAGIVAAGAVASAFALSGRLAPALAGVTGLIRGEFTRPVASLPPPPRPTGPLTMSDFTPRALIVAVVLAFAAASFVLGFFPTWLATLRTLPAVEPSAHPAIGDSGWGYDNVAALPWTDQFRRLDRRGSWVGGDAFTGEHVTGWYRPGVNATVMVAGYPLLAPNRLEAEARLPGGRTVVVPFAGENPRERWAAWQVPLPPGTEAFRLHGVDATTQPTGWLAFSEPISAPVRRTFDFTTTAKTLGAVALALLLVLGPGLVWRAARGGDLLTVLWPGPLALALGGGVCWALGGLVPPAFLARLWVLVTTAAVVAVGWRLRVWKTWTPFETRLLAVVALCVLGAAAKSAYSGGPAGELYAGSISRTLEVGDRSDSRISYHTVQVVAHHLSPYSPPAAKYYSPWDFSGRGPLVGLAAAPFVLATGGRPPLGMPDLAWQPFDREGFAAFRIAAIALAALALLAVAAVLARVADARRAWLGVALVALAPFFWHELYFTWPKFAAAACVLGAFRVALDGRAGLAALWIGAGFLCHPLALLSVPFLALWLLFQRAAPLALRFVRAVTFGLGVLAIIFLWHLANGFHPSQGGFLQYARAADAIYDVSPATWLLSRWRSFANTFLPFHVYTSAAGRAPFDASGLASAGVVRFFFQYWTAAPFAAGLLAALAVLPAFVRGLWRERAVAALALVGPTLLLLAYWGVTTTGLMREGAHVLFFSGWIFLAWAGAAWLPRWLFGAAFSALRAAEVLAMMFVPAFAAGLWRSNWVLNDAWWLAVSAACIAAVAAVIARAASRRSPD